MNYQVYGNELYHHGILGQKWGVRRYQYYDGSLTRAGLKRYNKSLANYEERKKKYSESKKLYKTAIKNNGSTVIDSDGRERILNVNKKSLQNELRGLKRELKDARRQVNKDYKHLKQDKLADEGKMFYRNGHTITNNSEQTRKMALLGGIAVSAVLANRDGLYTDQFPELKKLGAEKINAAVYSIGSLALVGATAKGIHDEYINRRLRAYYGHTSNY